MLGSMKFQTRMTLVYLALFMLVQGIITLAFYTTTYQNIDDQVRNQLSSSAKTFTAILESRVNDLAGRAQDQAGQFEFRDAIATRDEPTIRSALRNFSSRIDADLAIVYGLDGLPTAVVGGSGLNIENVPELSEDLQELAEAEGKATRILEISGRIYEIVVVPVLSPLPAAMLVYGIELDQVEALNIKRISSIDLEIAFLFTNEDGFQVASSTSGASTLNAFLKSNMTADQGAVFRAPYRGEDYMFWRLDMGDALDGPGDISALLYYSIDTALQPYINLALTLTGVIVMGILLLFVGGMILSRGVTRPLRHLAAATHRIAEGDYHEVSSVSKGDEIADLTNSFNRMVDAVQERENEIVFQAEHDHETGFPNRNHFDRELNTAIKKGDDFCLVFAEIQKLSDLRNVLNHSHVNDLLKGVGERIAQVSSVPVSRISTETFAFLLDDIENADVAVSLIINAFMTPFEITDIVVDASIKMGLAKFPADTKEPVKLTQFANSALDHGRQNPKSYAWYEASDTDDFKQHLSLMSDLREALGKGEVFFAYQPKLDLARGKITSAEALVRWVSPTRGFVPPNEFIEFAEQTGDVRHLTDWGLKTAVQQCANWRERGIDVAVAVNLSTSDLMNSNLPGQVLKLLRDYNLPSTSLKLEVTESAVMHDMNRALEVLNMLNAMGVPLSIDDYGTGYSSLSYLKKLPVSELKIDMSFVRNLASSEEDRILVRSTIDLGHNLGLQVTAEGVEDQKSVDLLREYGCDTLQGYFISKPVPAAEFEAFLEESRYK